MAVVGYDLNGDDDDLYKIILHKMLHLVYHFLYNIVLNPVLLGTFMIKGSYCSSFFFLYLFGVGHFDFILVPIANNWII